MPKSAFTVCPRILSFWMDEESTVRQVVDEAFREAGLPKVATIDVDRRWHGTSRLGVALLPSTAIESQASGKLRSRPIEGKSFARPIFIVCKKGRSLPPASEEYLSCLRTMKN